LKVLRADEEGRELLIYYVRAGESCIMSFLGGLHHETSKVRAEADEDVEILLLPMDKVVHFMKDFPEWLDYIFKLYHKRFEELLDVVNAIAFKKVDERLLDLLRRKEKMSASKVLHITHEQLANELGTARVLVSRLLKQLEEQGILELGRNKITLK
jgi:CRP/FNR family transcriptional regulator